MKARIPLPNDLKSAVKTEIEAEEYEEEILKLRRRVAELEEKE